MKIRLVEPILSKFFGKVKYQKFFKKLHQKALIGMNIGIGSHIDDSGEINVLNKIKKNSNDKLMIFDVGANVGDYTKYLLEYFKKDNIEVHCFEPGMSTFKSLNENLQGKNNVIFNNFGLSDVEGGATLYYDKESSGLASLYKRQLDYFNIEFEGNEAVKLSTLDIYCKKNNIKQIDLLKLDVEGNEINVLKGAQKVLKDNIIKNIQFEFGGCNIDSRTYFRDFWNMLGGSCEKFMKC